MHSDNEWRFLDFIITFLNGLQATFIIISMAYRLIRRFSDNVLIFYYFMYIYSSGIPILGPHKMGGFMVRVVRAATEPFPGINKTISSIKKQQHPTTLTTTPATTTGANSIIATPTTFINSRGKEQDTATSKVIIAMVTSVRILRMVIQGPQEHPSQQLMATTKHLVITLSVLPSDMF